MGKYFFTVLIVGLFAIANAQPYVINEKIDKVFSEGFSDINKSFPITPSNDPSFWGTYGDGYYYMERKQKSPRAVVANFDGTSKDFCIKSKLNLGPTRSNASSVGIMFLVQPGGRGGFVFELNRKKSFRVSDLATGAFITKDGKDGWIKNTNISPATRYSTVEIKAFRGKFDIYVNEVYVYSFVNKSYEKGKCGLYIGPESTAKVMYFNVYTLDIPSAPKEINLKELQKEIDLLKNQNDSLRTVALGKQYGDNNNAAIEAIKILEDQVKAARDENEHLKGILQNYETNEPVVSSDEEKASVDVMVEKIDKLSAERDSVLNLLTNGNESTTQLQSENDSLKIVVEELQSKVAYLNKHAEEIQKEIEKINNYKAPSQPSNQPIPPSTTPSMPSSQATQKIEMGSEEMKKANTGQPKSDLYESSLDTDTEIGFSDDENFDISEEKKDTTVTLIPLKGQKIKVKKAVKTE